MQQHRSESLTRERGAKAEQAVCELLEGRGFRIVARNLRLGSLELDIVARQGPLVVVVEVRSRGARSWTTGFGSLNAMKRWRIRLAGARLWHRRYARDPTVERLRFDAASVTWRRGQAVVEYVEAAF